MKPLRAEVRRITGQTLHTSGHVGPMGLEVKGALPPPDFVEIKADASGFFLLRFNSQGVFSGDTWHQSVEEAKAQARFEYEIAEHDWVEKN